MVNSSLKSEWLPFSTLTPDSLARRNHKERAQPLHRQRLGLLEKHKDYVHRARDYRSKQDRVRKLREKAAFRNKDEFYWGMVKGKTKGGVALTDRGNEALSVDLVKVLKTQDVGYVRVQIAKDVKQIAKLRAELEITAPAASSSSEWTAASELHEVEKLVQMGVILKPRDSAVNARQGKAKASPTGHVLFFDGREEFMTYGSGLSRSPGPERSVEEPVDLGWVDPVPPKRRKNPVTPASPKDDAEDVAQEAREHRLSLLTSLSAYLGRVRLLRQAEQKLGATKAMMGKGAVKKVREAKWVDDDKAPEDRNGERKRHEGKMWKWKIERKR